MERVVAYSRASRWPGYISGSSSRTYADHTDYPLGLRKLARLLLDSHICRVLGLARSRANFVRTIKALCRFLRGRRYSLDVAIACAGSGLGSCRGGECSHTTFAIDNAGNFLMPRHSKSSEAKAPIGGTAAALSPKHDLGSRRSQNSSSVPGRRICHRWPCILVVFFLHP